MCTGYPVVTASAAWWDGPPNSEPKPARPDALARALAAPDPAGIEARRLANIAAAPPLPVGQRGTLRAEAAWLLGDWTADPNGTPVLGRVRLLDGRQAQGEVADVKRPLWGPEATVDEAWRYCCMAFGWLDPPAVYQEAGKVCGLEWVWIQFQRSQQ